MSLTEKEFKSVTNSIEGALGLPNRAYTDDAFLQAEFERVLRKSWIGIAFEHDVAQPGDIYPVTAAGQPLIVVRGHDGQVRVFHNACRHRGTKLLEQPCTNRRKIICPYHAWTYGLDGSLIATPHFSGPQDHSHPTLEDGNRHLVEVRSGIWNHVILVNLSADAVPLREWTARLDARWAAIDVAATVPAEGMQFEFDANWKLVLENFLESYHLPAVHPTLNAFSPLEDHVLVVDDLFMGQLSLNYRPSDDGNALPRFAELPPDRQAAGEYLLLFPSLMVSLTPDHYRVTLVTPVTAGFTRQRWQFFFVGEESRDHRFDASRQAVLQRVAAYTKEDIAILEKLQAGRQSSGFDGGRFSPFHETTVHRFQGLIARSLARGCA